MEHEHSHENTAPRVPLMLAGGLVVLTLLGVVWQQLVVNPAAPERDPPRVVAEQTLQFIDHADGSVSVITLPERSVIDTVAAGEGNFLRGTLRGLVRERRLNDASMEPGFVVARYADGAVVVTDLATGRRIDLRAFGPENANDFVRYLPSGNVAHREPDATRIAKAEE